MNSCKGLKFIKAKLERILIMIYSLWDFLSSDNKRTWNYFFDSFRERDDKDFIIDMSVYHSWFDFGNKGFEPDFIDDLVDVQYLLINSYMIFRLKLVMKESLLIMLHQHSMTSLLGWSFRWW